MAMIVLNKCRRLLKAYQEGLLGNQAMPEDTHPHFKNHELRLSYFTLPMALNYQRDSYKLWQAALATYNDPETHDVFKLNTPDLKTKLLKYKLALQPNKHIHTWKALQNTILSKFGSFEELFVFTDSDFLKLKELIQVNFKSEFPYLSGPKIFNYWSFIISTYGRINLQNRQYIDIAPDAHVTRCSIILGVIREFEADNKILISHRWRELLDGSGIDPIDMHSPLWFWSRNSFKFKL